jgi:hypothetical protein
MEIVILNIANHHLYPNFGVPCYQKLLFVTVKVKDMQTQNARAQLPATLSKAGYLAIWSTVNISAMKWLQSVLAMGLLKPQVWLQVKPIALPLS